MMVMTHKPLLELSQISYRYPDGSVGLDACSIAIQRGSRNVLIGANGSGKTTLFQHTNGLLRPQTGVVRYAGMAVDYSRAGLRALRSQVGMVFQNPDHQLFPPAFRKTSRSGRSISGSTWPRYASVSQRLCRPSA